MEVITIIIQIRDRSLKFNEYSFFSLWFKTLSSKAYRKHSKIHNILLKFIYGFSFLTIWYIL